MICRLLLLGMALQACSPAPHSADDFAAHPALARRIQSDCAAGRVRGADCTNADIGAARAAAAARQSAYRKGF
jgi:hypothetical protein